MKKWDLNKLYTGIDDLNFKEDSKKLIHIIDLLVESETDFSDYQDKKQKLWTCWRWACRWAPSFWTCSHRSSSSIW